MANGKLDVIKEMEAAGHLTCHPIICEMSMSSEWQKSYIINQSSYRLSDCILLPPALQELCAICVSLESWHSEFYKFMTVTQTSELHLLKSSNLLIPLKHDCVLPSKQLQTPSGAFQKRSPVLFVCSDLVDFGVTAVHLVQQMISGISTS